jgi:hypothetical protein
MKKSQYESIQKFWGSQHKGKPFCPHGHGLTAENTYAVVKQDGRIYDKCRTCALAVMKRKRSE